MTLRTPSPTPGSTPQPTPAPTPQPTPSRTSLRVDEAVLADLCDRIFGSLPRSDQRQRGEKYLRGLLVTDGRRSFRQMAVCLGGGPTLEQRLHHFVSCSTWDWMPVSQALAAAMARVAPPRAWVLSPLHIPKEGDNSVGVHRYYVPELGQTINAQYAVGLWAASPTLTYPVGWRLLLPHVWLDDPVRRAQVGIPDGRGPETPVECAVEAYLDMAAHARGALPVRPVVLAVGGADARVAVDRLRAAQVPFLVRTDSGAGAGAGARARADRAPDDRDGLLLFGTGTDPARRPDEVWLTDMLDADPAELLSLTGLLGHVDDSFGRITDRIGLRDFTGRTFNGWNRHATLASAAHSVALLSG